jgi:hypothetical protein
MIWPMRSFVGDICVLHLLGQMAPASRRTSKSLTALIPAQTRPIPTKTTVANFSPVAFFKTRCTIQESTYQKEESNYGLYLQMQKDCVKETSQEETRR